MIYIEYFGTSLGWYLCVFDGIEMFWAVCGVSTNKYTVKMGNNYIGGMS